MILSALGKDSERGIGLLVLWVPCSLVPWSPGPLVPWLSEKDARTRKRKGPLTFADKLKMNLLVTSSEKRLADINKRLSATVLSNRKANKMRGRLVTLQTD